MLLAKKIDDERILIQVQDTGVGISKENLKVVFEYFTKIMDNRSLNKEGCGLGLTISKNLAKALGGDMEVESEIGKGTVFSLTIRELI